MITLFGIQGFESELYQSYNTISQSKLMQWDVLEFCLCAALGQVIIFQIMKEFGSLAWVTISVTRKLFTIMVSVITFNHHVSPFQWTGVASVFVGMSLDLIMSKSDDQKKKKTE